MQEQLSAAGRLELAPADWLLRERAGYWWRRARTVGRRWLLSDVLSIFLATRLAFLLLTYFGLALLHDPALVGSTGVDVPSFQLSPWEYRDSQWYQTIGTDGYHYYGPGHRSAIAFFPIYPMVAKAVHMLSGIGLDVSLILVANFSFLGALIYLYKLCKREYGEAVAHRAIFYMAVFPSAFFSFAPYSEPLFLFLSVASLYYMRGRRWWLAGLFGGFAAGTRILGVLLILAFIWEYLDSKDFKLRRIRGDLLAGALIPAGIGAYMLYLYGLTGDPLAFVRSAAGWNRVAMWPWQVLSTSLSDVPKSGVNHPYFQAHALIENGLVVACLLTLLLGIRRIPFSFIIYGLTSMAVLLSAPVISCLIPITSMSRYLFVLAPVYIILARWGRWPIFDRLYVLLSAGGLALSATLFLNHMWGA